jgi:hypothetical protein
MWVVGQVEARGRELDFSSSGSGRRPTTSLVADGVEIVNAIDFLDVPPDAADPVQLTTCEQCATPGCNSGGWVVLRRLNNGLIMIPAFSEMSDDSWGDFEPPYFLKKGGAPLFTGAALDLLRAYLPAFADVPRWSPLNSREAVLLLQWEAPHGVLERFPVAPRLRDDFIAASTHGKGREALGILSALLAEATLARQPVSLVSGESVTFYLDNAGYSEWQPMVFVDDAYRLALAPGVGVLFDDRSA